MTDTQATGRWRLECTINGSRVEMDVDPCQTLLTVLRDRLGLTGTKGSCLEGECGSCTVIVDGQPINSCLVLAPQMQGHCIETIEGLARGEKLHILQEKFLESGAVQCGYCTPGLIMAAKAMLDAKANPSEEELLQGIEGNICRCTGYRSIYKAIRSAAREWR